MHSGGGPATNDPSPEHGDAPGPTAPLAVVPASSAEPVAVPELSDEVLRPALEVAFAIAVAGSRLRPPVASPSSLKRFLKFQKLPGSALAVVRRAIEDDDEFRVRAASVASVELAGEIGWRWLVRADGWEAEVADLVARAAEDDESEAIGRADRTATRQRDNAERAAVKARAALAVTKEELAREHERRTAAERTSADAVRRAEELERQLADHRLDVRKARDQADAARGSVHDLRNQLDDAERRVLELGERLEREIAARVGAEERAAGAAVLPAGGRGSETGASSTRPRWPVRWPR